MIFLFSSHADVSVFRVFIQSQSVCCDSRHQFQGSRYYRTGILAGGGLSVRYCSCYIKHLHRRVKIHFPSARHAFMGEGSTSIASLIPNLGTR